MKDTFWIDWETYNERPIKVGTYAYAETAEVLLGSYALNDGAVQLWDAAQGEPMPKIIREAFADADNVELGAHHATFDRNIAKYALGLESDPTQWFCTMVQAYLHALPGSLEALGKVLGLGGDLAKIKDGKKLINKFCKPAPANRKVARYDHTTDPADWERFREYAIQDTVAMRECRARMPFVNLGGNGLRGYHLDQRINDRGFAVDMELVRAGVKAADEEKSRLAEEFYDKVGGVVRPTQREKFRLYLNERFGLELDNTQADTFRGLMAEGGLDPAAEDLMNMAIMSNKTSTAKYRTLEPAVSSDGRFRGGLQYAGAARTRRWAGRTFQPQNLPSRGLPSGKQVERYIEALKMGVHDVLFDDLMLYGSASLRGVVVAPEGRKLVVSDLSNIEGRINAWLAGEKWKIKAFEDFDAGTGFDLYNITAGGLLGKHPGKITKSERNAMGKVPELALGYAGGFGAFQTFSQAYNIKMADLWDTIQQNVKPMYTKRARENWYNWGADRLVTHGGYEGDVEDMRLEWIASESVKLAWRGRHPAIEALWNACENAARLAIKKPGKVFAAGKFLKFSVREFGGKRYLLMRLPTGQYLIYSSPRISENSGSIIYMGIDSTATGGGAFGKWQPIATYGGKFVENACQTIGRDVLYAGMELAEADGYEIVLTVHDELVTEVEDTKEFSDGALSALLARPVAGCEGLPLAAAGFETYRYKKED